MPRASGSSAWDGGVVQGTDPEPHLSVGYALQMAWIKIIDEPDATGELAELYGGMEDPQYGRVDTILRIHSLHPGGLRTHHDLYREVMTGISTLRKVDREMIALVVSKINDCHY
jgi:alkylhydroperoxidase family enzyme